MQTKQYKIWLVKVLENSKGCEYTFLILKSEFKELAIRYAENWAVNTGFRVAHVTTNTI